ncbi:hypothetical protein F5Y17DRAFT_439783 [Xylariaceae sp. FL0594]|nr:hypothetical protein F5Y17DRAFT_439783 [Xylariaceae sp. FL0594]
MQARDAEGRKVSLLNDEGVNSAVSSYPSPQQHPSPQQYPSPQQLPLLGQYPLPDCPSPGQYASHSQRPSPAPYFQGPYFSPATHYSPSAYSLGRSQVPLGNPPSLSRSESFDSTLSHEPTTPITPLYLDNPAARSCHDEYGFQEKQPRLMRRHAYIANHRGSSAEPTRPTQPLDKVGKRYPCRLRESHGCEKTFTTSGHASRHSKIHTSEKGVQCTYPGCPKKFTRADNMKQHLETHFKEKSRTSSASKSKGTPLPIPSPSSSSSSKRGSVSSKSSFSTQSSRASRDIAMWDADEDNNDRHSLFGPGSTLLDMSGADALSKGRPLTIQTIGGGGLDVLAAAIACQEKE